MPIKDIVTLVVSLLGATLSIYTLYRTQFRKPNISLIMGPFVHLYYGLNKGSGVYLPVVFQNSSPVSGFVYKAYLVIKTSSGNHVAMRWLESTEIDPITIEYKSKGLSKPFQVQGYSAVDDAFQFYHPVVHNGVPDLRFIEGQYVVTLYVWTSSSTMPDLKSSEILNINSENANQLQENLVSGKSNTRYMALERRATTSVVTGKVEPDFSRQEFR